MQFRIDNSSQRPIYQQIIDQIKRDIALNKLRQGEQLPTVRQLASQLVINPNTIAKAYRQLEKDGIIVTKAGAGAFVAELNSSLSKSVRRKIIVQQLELIAVEAIHMQMDKKTLTELFGSTLEKFKYE